MATAKNVYKIGGGGGMGSYIIVIKRTGTGSAFETNCEWRRVLGSYANAETLYLSVVELDGSYRVLNTDIIRENHQLKLVSFDSYNNKIYTITADRLGVISIAEDDAGGGGSLDNYYTKGEVDRLLLDKASVDDVEAALELIQKQIDDLEAEVQTIKMDGGEYV